jgi:hypothetical protein
MVEVMSYTRTLQKTKQRESKMNAFSDSWETDTKAFQHSKEIRNILFW